MPEEIMRFGLYRPLTEESAAQVRAVATTACGEVTEYLENCGNYSPVRVRHDFGKTILRVDLMVSHFTTHPKQQANIPAFIDDITTHLRPNESDALPIRLGDVTLPGGAKSDRVMVAPDRTTNQFNRFAAQTACAVSFARKRFPGIRLSTKRMAQFPILKYGEPGNKQDLSDRQRDWIWSVVTTAMTRADLRMVVFGRLVIGSGYREPLAGAEWPPQLD